MIDRVLARVRSMLVAESRGQGLAEYALILGLIAIVAILSLVFLGTAIGGTLQFITDTVSSHT